MKFNYYYGSQAEQFSFIRIPRIILTGTEFHSLSMTAKMLYGVLLDRMNLSMKNGWVDEENRVYIIYQIREIQEDMGFSRKKAIDLLSELEIFGLLQKKRRGRGLPNFLYVKNFMKDTEIQNDEKKGSDIKENATQERKSQSHEVINPELQEVKKSALQEVTTSGLQEVRNTALLKNKTDINKIYMNKTESNLIVSMDRPAATDTIRNDEDMATDSPGKKVKLYEQIIRENICYDDLLTTHADDSELIEGIKDLILETVVGMRKEILISSTRYPAEVVRSKFLKLNYFHIEYVLHCLKQNTTKVKNIRKYILAALFNAPSTMDGYYQAKVNHDMPQYAMAR